MGQADELRSMTVLKRRTFLTVPVVSSISSQMADSAHTYHFLPISQKNADEANFQLVSGKVDPT